jgi:aminotransferase
VAPSGLTDGIRKMHDFLTVAAPAPFQEAGAVALALPGDYYAAIGANYQRLRDRLVSILEARGFVCHRPQGAYYLMADISAFGFKDDVAFARYLVREIGVATIPGSSFYRDQRDGASLLRFCFSKRDDTLEEAARRLARLTAIESGR